jgi:hypothetical protein
VDSFGNSRTFSCTGDNDYCFHRVGTFAYAGRLRHDIAGNGVLCICRSVRYKRISTSLIQKKDADEVDFQHFLLQPGQFLYFLSIYISVGAPLIASFYASEI